MLDIDVIKIYCPIKNVCVILSLPVSFTFLFYNRHSQLQKKSVYGISKTYYCFCCLTLEFCIPFFSGYVIMSQKNIGFLIIDTF